MSDEELTAFNRKRTRRNAIKPNSQESMALFEFSLQHNMTAVRLVDAEEEPVKRARENPPDGTGGVEEGKLTAGAAAAGGPSQVAVADAGYPDPTERDSAGRESDESASDTEPAEPSYESSLAVQPLMTVDLEDVELTLRPAQ